MIEKLEQHCEAEFNKLRTGFQNAYFKDNNSTSGGKGDFIYKETDAHGNEIISIMFEMKMKRIKRYKKRNEDFFKELNKDRIEKNVNMLFLSLLESESELYNTGIVDVSHRY